MIALKIPPFLSIGKKYGLLISDTDVNFVSWKNGELENIAAFVNEDEGVAAFAAFLKEHAATYDNKAIYILTNIIGEDYRFEKVAHLIGKFKTDFHERRMNQLFRGSSLTLSEVQGREEHGRREDLVLFYGLLAEGKVLPWMNVSARPDSGRYLAGVYGVSFVSQPILMQVSDSRKGNTLLMTLHEKGLLRQVYYTGKQMRFSRVSKIADDSAEKMAAAVRKELERTVQYLNSLKISVVGGIDVHFICPGNLVGQLRELLSGGDKVKFSFHDAAAVAQGMGLKSSIGELGRDSSLALACMFSRLHIHQLAKFDRIRYFWVKGVATAAIIAFALYGVITSVPLVTNFLEIQDVANNNTRLTEQRDLAKKNYNEQTGFGNPPSSPENIAATSRVFSLVSDIQVAPGQLLYYFARGIEGAPRLGISRIRWFLTDNPDDSRGSSRSLFSGNDLFQVLEVDGEFLPIANETYLDVAARAERLLDTFEDRADIRIVPTRIPSSEVPAGSLSGVISDSLEIEAARDRAFSLRVIWKSHEAGYMEKFITQI